MRRTLMTTGRGAILSGLVAAGLLIGAATPAVADGSRGGDAGPRGDPAYEEGVKAVKRGDYPTAIRLLEQVVAQDGRNADAYNWLGYSIRHNGDAARAIPIYEKALSVDPKHKGAHEYIGEAYLILGDVGKAKVHLAALDKLCLFPCEEYTDLKKAVQAYETSGGRIKPSSKP